MTNSEIVLRTERNLSWLHQPHESRIILSTTLPPRELVTTAFVLAFSENKLLMTDLTDRGWDIPGGHVELGEIPEETARREVFEETHATLGELHLLGYQHIRLLERPPAVYKYPYPDSYQVFYWSQIERLDRFQPTAEAQGRDLFAPPEAETLSWIQANKDLYEAALHGAIS